MAQGKRVVLTTKQRRDVIARSMDGESMRSIAKVYQVSANTIKKILSSEKDFAQKCAHKKQQGDEDFFAFLKTKDKALRTVVDLCLSFLSDPEKYEKATLQQIISVFGVIHDKKMAEANHRLQVEKFNHEKVEEINAEIEGLTPLVELLKHDTNQSNQVESL